jgi:hypothetical protein
MMIVGGVVLLLVIIIIVVLFTRPSSTPAPASAPGAPKPDGASKPPATVPVGSAPTSHLGKEVVGPTAAKTPEQQMAAKDAQAALRATANAGMTRTELQDRQAQAQRDAGKSVDVRKNINF